MTDITLGSTPASTHRGSNVFVHRVLGRTRLWRQRMRARDELARLSRRDLADIGLSVVQAEFEAAKPFWIR